MDWLSVYSGVGIALIMILIFSLGCRIERRRALACVSDAAKRVRGVALTVKGGGGEHTANGARWTAGLIAVMIREGWREGDLPKQPSSKGMMR